MTTTTFEVALTIADTTFNPQKDLEVAVPVAFLVVGSDRPIDTKTRFTYKQDVMGGIQVEGTIVECSGFFVLVGQTFTTIHKSVAGFNSHPDIILCVEVMDVLVTEVNRRTDTADGYEAIVSVNGTPVVIDFIFENDHSTRSPVRAVKILAEHSTNGSLRWLLCVTLNIHYLGNETIVMRPVAI